MKKRIVKKHKIKWKILLKLFLVVFVIFLFISLLKYIPTRHIEVNNNKYLSDSDIIYLSELSYYPNIFTINTDKVKNNLLNNPYVSDVKVRKNVLGFLKIDVKERIPLFYDIKTGSIILSENKSYQTNNSLGLPIIYTNDMPNDILERLVKNFSMINDDVKYLISDITYSPWKNNDIVIDDTRFLLNMNDGNKVYINLLHLEKLNNYIEIYSTLEGKVGSLYLDSSSDRIFFSAS